MKKNCPIPVSLRTVSLAALLGASLILGGCGKSGTPHVSDGGSDVRSSEGGVDLGEAGGGRDGVADLGSDRSRDTLAPDGARVDALEPGPGTDAPVDGPVNPGDTGGSSGNGGAAGGTGNGSTVSTAGRGGSASSGGADSRGGATSSSGGATSSGAAGRSGGATSTGAAGRSGGAGNVAGAIAGSSGGAGSVAGAIAGSSGGAGNVAGAIAGSSGGAGNVAGDTSAPIVTFTTPTSGAVGVPTNSNIVLAFNEGMNCATMSASALRVVRSADGVSVGEGTVACSGQGVTLTLPAPMLPDTLYAATVSTAVTDLAGNHLAVAYSWSFTTAAAPDTTAPTIVSTTPTSGATGVPTNSNLVVAFSEAMDCATMGANAFTVVQAGSGVTAVEVTVACSGQGATLTLPVAMLPDTLYTATVSTAVTDLAGNHLAAAHSWNFRTAAAPDTSAPTVTSTTPSAGAVDVSMDSNFVVSFSEDVDCATMNVASLTVVRAVDGASVGEGAVACSGHSATLTLASPLAPATLYTATVSTAVTDLAGNHLAAAYVWSFTTVAAPDTSAPTVASTTPASWAVGVPLNSSIAITFSEDMDCATVNSSSIFVVQPEVGSSLGGASVSCNGKVATLSFADPFQQGALHTVTVTTAVTDLAGNHLAAEYSWSFTTGLADTTAPTVVSTTPAPDAMNVSTSSSMVVTFSEDMDCARLTNLMIWVSRVSDGAPSFGGVVCSGKVATLALTGPMDPDTIYTAYVSTSVSDLAGNHLAAEYSWSFRTVAAADTTSPTVVSTTPAPDAVGVSANSSIVVTFSEDMDCTTVSNTRIWVARVSDSTTPAVNVVCSGKVATLTLTDPMLPNTLYSAYVSSFVSDLAGNRLAAEHSWTFTTAAAADTTAPTVVSTTPAMNAADVSTNSSIVVTFSEDMDCATVSNSRIWVSRVSDSVSSFGNVVCNGKVATLTLTDPMDPNTRYTAYVATLLTDLAGNPLAAQYMWTFTTAAAADTTAPTVVSTTPTSGAGGVAINADFVVTFSEAMDCATLTSSSIFVVRAADGSSAGNGSVACTGSGVRLVLDAQMLPSTVYTATVSGAVTDLAGNHMAANYSWSFTTAAADTTAPTIVSTIPQSNASNVAIDASFAVTFSEPIDCSTATTGTLGTVLLFRASDGHAVAGSVGCQGEAVTFTPAAPLEHGTVYTAMIDSGITDLAGNHMTTYYVWTYTTVGAPAPTVVSVSPQAGSSGAPVGTVISFQLSAPLACNTLSVSTFTLTDAGGHLVAGTVLCADTTGTFTPSQPLADGMLYTATVAAAVADGNGQPLAQDYNWTFTTVSRTWGTAQTIDDTLALVEFPRMAMARSGQAVAVWSQWDNQDSNVHRASYSPGAGWSAAIGITDPRFYDSDRPRVAMSTTDDAIVVWEQSTLRSQGFDATAGTWDAGSHIAAAGSTGSEVVMDGNGNGLVIFRVDEGGGTYGLFSTRYRDGTGWDAQDVLKRVSRAGFNNGGVQISMNWAGTAFAVWEETSGSGVVSIMSNTYTHANGWGFPVQVAGSGDDPKIAVDTYGNAVALWQRSPDAVTQTVSFRRYTVGTGWGETILLDTMSGNALTVARIAVDAAGNVVATWVHRETNTRKVMSNRCKVPCAAADWGTPETVWSSSDETLNMDMALDPSGYPAIVWQVTNDVVASRYRPGAGWSTPGKLGNGVNWVDDIKLGMDGSGNALVVWTERTAGGAYDIWSNSFRLAAL